MTTNQSTNCQHTTPRAFAPLVIATGATADYVLPLLPTIVGMPPDERVMFWHGTAVPDLIATNADLDMAIVVSDGIGDDEEAERAAGVFATRGALTFVFCRRASAALVEASRRQGCCLVEAEHIDHVVRGAAIPLNSLMVPGIIGIDFGDFVQLFGGGHRGVCVHKQACGPDRAFVAARTALDHVGNRFPLNTAGLSVAMLFTGPPNLSLHEINSASSILEGAVPDDANIIFAMCVDEAMKDEFGVSVMVTGPMQPLATISELRDDP